MNTIPTFEQIIMNAPSGVVGLLNDCKNTPQSPTWHPEGDVFVHTRIVYNRARKFEDMNLALAALFHDLGKPATTKKNSKGSWSSYGHEMVSGKIVETHKDWILYMGGDFDKILNIVILHMKIKLIGEMKPAKQEILRNNPVYQDLLNFTECDNMKTLTPEELGIN